jgi:hypothetical protein
MSCICKVIYSKQLCVLCCNNILEYLEVIHRWAVLQGCCQDISQQLQMQARSGASNGCCFTGS